MHGGLIIAKTSQLTIALLWAWVPLTCFALWAAYRDPSAVLSLAVSPDGKRVAVSRMGPSGSELEIWSTDETPRIIHQVPMKGGLHAAFVDDRRILIQPFYDFDWRKPIVVLDVDSWKQLWQFPVSSFPCNLECGAGNFVIYDDETTRVFDADTYQEKFNTKSGHTTHLSPDGKLLAIKSSDGWRCISVDTGAEVLSVPSTTWDACFSTDGQTFLCFEGSELTAFDLASDSRDVVGKSKQLAGSYRTGRMIPTKDGIVFFDGTDQYLKIIEYDTFLTRTLCPSRFNFLRVEPVNDSRVWIGNCTGYLGSLDLSTGELTPLQLHMRNYAGGLWLLWCVVWFVARARHARLGTPPAAPRSFGGPVLDLLLTIVPIIAYLSLLTYAGIGWSQYFIPWSTCAAIGVMASVANFIVLWLVLGQASICKRLLWATAGFAVLVGVGHAHCLWLSVSGDWGYMLFVIAVIMLAQTLTWWAYRWRASWRLALAERAVESQSVPKSKRPQWSIRNLLVLTAAAAVIVQVARHVDLRQYMNWNLFEFSSAVRGPMLIYLHAMVPTIVLLSTWSYIKRLSLLCLLPLVYWGFWTESAGSMEESMLIVLNLAWSSFAICGILRLHGYRIIKLHKPTSASAPSAVDFRGQEAPCQLPHSASA